MEQHDLMQQLYKELNNDGYKGLKFDFCCPGRHGSIIGVPTDMANDINEFLVYYFGPKCARWTDTVNGKRNVEFVPMTKVYPPPKKPWEWCGKTMLFESWRLQEIASKTAVDNFSIGDPVWFTYQATRYEGVVANIVKRVTVVVPHHGKFYIPGKDLHHA